MAAVIPEEVIENKIFLIRGHKVMLDKDLAKLYGVTPRALRQQVKRNRDRFPDDFIFQLTDKELRIMVSQNVTPSLSQYGGYLPYAFTEQGVAMLSGVIHSKRAIQVNIVIMRTFVKLREFLSTHKELAHKLKELEGKVDKHDAEILMIFDAIRQLMAPTPATAPERPKRRIGFLEK